mgnify:CR=1 FL=1|tara:strand:+ start:2760 stop:3164 length:405 start_codon:yes stop_codon:yes gene_type:complete
MTWLSAKLFFSKAWSFLKEYWQIPFMAIWTIITIVLVRRNTDALKDVISAKQESHSKQVESLKRNHREQILKMKGLQHQYLETIARLQSKFKEQNKKLSEKHAEDVKEIVIKSKGNPEEIIRKIENDFGIKFKK